MSDISKYPTAGSIKLSDKLVGTSVGGEPVDATKNFLLSQIGTITQQNMTATAIVITSVSEYEDNEAALAGGLLEGNIYRTSDGTLKIVY
jgi:hypothetical protein